MSDSAGGAVWVTRQTAKAHLERRGVTIRSELPALNEEQITQAVAFYADGWGLNPIATRLGVAPNTVKRALLAQGVRLRQRGLPGLGQPETDPARSLGIAGCAGAGVGGQPHRFRY